MAKQKPKIYASKIIQEGILYEMVYDQKNNATQFVTLEENIPTYYDSIITPQGPVYPHPPDTNILNKNVVLFASEPVNYESEEKLLEEIRAFIHKYLEVSPFLEKVAPYYILLTWIYERFRELPYLRALADYGSGKSRFLKTIGSLCYKATMTVGASTTAPIFRILDIYNGTLVIDEADMRFSDTTNELVKILNNGFQAGNPVLRCAEKKGQWDVVAFEVYGPKIVATRGVYTDKALESRFLIEKMDNKLTRKDIPLNLPESFETEAQAIRNKCLMWRLHNYWLINTNDIIRDKSIEPRLNQIMFPLMAIVEDDGLKIEIQEHFRRYNAELKVDRSFSFEAQILEVVIELMEKQDNEVTMKRISECYNTKFERTEKELSPRKIGSILKNKLGLPTIKTRYGRVVDPDIYSKKIDTLVDKFDITNGGGVNDVNIVNIPEDNELAKQSIKIEDVPFL